MIIRLGDIRDEFGRDLAKKLENIINDNTKRDDYYILIISKPDRLLSAQLGAHAVKTTFQIHNILPPQMLGTSCLKINNRRGKITRLWVNPLDIPRDPQIITDKGVKDVFQSAQGMPIIH
jgi:hypothetical protein